MWQPNLALSSNQNLDFIFERDGELVDLGKTQLAYSPNLISGSSLTYTASTNFQITLLSKFVGKQYMGNIDSENSILPSYFINDLNISYVWRPNKLLKEIQFSFLINNLLNKQYESNGYFYTYNDTWSVPGKITTIEGAGFYPQAGINFLTGLMIKF